MDAHLLRAWRRAANMTEPMPTCTTDIASSFVVAARDLRPAARRRRYPQPHGLAGGFSTPAGLHRRPWFERLRKAIEQELFVLHYQPIVSLRQGRISGGAVSHYEALIRLADDPCGPLTAPACFLPAAERYGLIGEIDRLVLAKAIAVLGGELRERQARIAVNLSALSVTDRSLLGFIEGLLAHHRVDPGRLIVELTETAAISDMALAQQFCEGVHRIGAAVALDDFGAGFGSFQYLKRLPFRYLKIDGDFIRALPTSRKDQLLVQALAGLAKGMGKQTIAEYVGDEQTLELLRAYGIDYAQGFEVGRPCGQPHAFAAAI
jgi:EAL domain-containing protein (putative c-di-GMP-specific phosphodiesterase class I)